VGYIGDGGFNLMANLSIDPGRLAAFLAAYHEAVRDGFTPIDQHTNATSPAATAEAARKIGISRHQRQRWVTALRAEGKLGPAIRRDTFTPPKIPTAHEPIDAMIERRAEAFERKRAASKAKEWMLFRVDEVAPFCLVFVGDPHADDDGCDLPTLKRHLELIEATPGMWAVGMGDWTNNWIGRLSRLYAEQGTTASDAWRFAEWMLGKPIWMLLLRGNHDMWSGAGDPLRWITREGLAPLVDWQAQFRVACGDAEWKINAAHDFPGHSMWNRLHSPMRRAKMTGHNADLFIAAHRHTFALGEEQDEHSGRVSWLARAKGYKAIDTYANNLGYGDQQDRGQSIAAVCNPSTGRMQCFSDLDEAAAYLAWLRRPRVRVKAA
jgi:transposase-like protein